MVERVEKFRSELERLCFPHTEVLRDRHIPVALWRPQDRTSAHIAEAGAVSDGWQGTQHSLRFAVQVARSAGQSAGHPVLNAPRGEQVRVGLSGAQLRRRTEPADATHALAAKEDRSSCILDRHIDAVLDGRYTGQAPTIDQRSLPTLRMPERQIPYVIEYEALGVI